MKLIVVLMLSISLINCGPEEPDIEINYPCGGIVECTDIVKLGDSITDPKFGTLFQDTKTHRLLDENICVDTYTFSRYDFNEGEWSYLITIRTTCDGIVTTIYN